MAKFLKYSDRHRSPAPLEGLSKTKQSFKEECDINNLLKKYKKTGLIEHVSQYNGDYRDLSEPVDYQSALNIVLSAQGAFDSLPATVRKEFNNNPGQFLEFVNNPDNAGKLVEMGLANPPAAPTSVSPNSEQVDLPPTPENTAAS